MELQITEEGSYYYICYLGYLKVPTSGEVWPNQAYNKTLMSSVQPQRKSIWRVIRELKIDLLSDPAKPFLGMYSDEVKYAHE